MSLNRFLFVVVLCISNLVSAKLVEIVDIQSSIDGDKRAHLWLEIDDTNQKLNSLHYQNRPDKPIRVFALEDLAKSKATIVNKGPVDVVQISTENIDEKSFFLDITFLYEFNFFSSSERKTKRFKVIVNPKDQIKVSDVDSGKTTKLLYTHVRLINGKQKGIESIEAL